ncbi:Aryl hydrocarbon receptor nuclear translocator-like protein 2 [Myotis davidii]|uniref:Aryl hydrocarbon receptor nuclear translocator-like protein 2 n=1 Tax=Myotis davidii TaxID=225400 RepID=L5M6A0_MYODS|nr:Aryl hydrocarbon receptor nuclear translocator-like protein 2 [Myotis davidii]
MVSNRMSIWAKPTAVGSFNPHVTEFPRKRKENDLDLSQEAHSQTEKRRRDKMNSLIEELSAMIPQCKPMARKLDKLTVLRMAVQHLKSLKGMRNSYAGDIYRPSFIQDNELRHLVLKTAEGFLFVVGCERGKILFVSKSVSKILNYDQASLTGQSLFDFLHPKDVAKVKEQLSSDISPREKLIDVKTGLQVHSNFHGGRTRVCSGSRRSFFCRMKSCKVSVKEEHDCSPDATKKVPSPLSSARAAGVARPLEYPSPLSTPSLPGLAQGAGKLWMVAAQLKREVQASLKWQLPSRPGPPEACTAGSGSSRDHRKFCTVHCTGYLRSWPTNTIGMEEERNSKEDSNFTCLVAIGRLYPNTVPRNSGEVKVKPTEFITRFAMNGKFVYVDQRATTILGYLPQELLGTSCYEYFHQDDHNKLTNKHKAVLQSKEKIFTDSYKFRAKDGSFVTLKSQWFSFTNPWTKELEYIVSVNTLVLGHSETGGASSLPYSSQSLEESCVSVPGLCTGTVLGAGSIGTDIANEALDLQRLQSSSSLGDSSPTDLMKDTHTINCRNMSNKELIPLNLSEIGELEATRQNHSTVAPHSHEPLLGGGAQLDFDTLWGNDGTAIAAFMNYLEVQGGLGEPEDFSDIPWTL